MNNFLKRTLKENAVYWAPDTKDGFGGRTYKDPVDLKVRWEQKSRVITDAEGKESVSDAEVYVLIDLEMEGKLWKGSTEDGDYSSSSEMVEEAYEIKGFEKLPSLKSGQFIRKAYLGKGKNG